MIRFNECLLIALIYGAHVIGRLHAAPNNRKLFSLANGTTTAIPLYNASSTSAHTPTGTTSIPMVQTTTGNRLFTTNANFDSSTSTKLTTIATSPIIHTSPSYRQEIGQRHSDTTTAAPPFVEPITAYRQFDALSFIGGCLLTICLVIFGTMVWKMYIAHVERRYWTL